VLAALLTLLALLLAGLLARLLLLLALRILLARLIVLVGHVILRGWIYQPFGENRFLAQSVPEKPQSSLGFFVLFPTLAQMRGTPDFAPATCFGMN
jgi:hypothetical protein